MTEGITQRQKEVLDYIEKYQDEHGISPSYEEIAAALNMRAKSNVHRLVLGLIDRGLIRARHKQSRSITVIQKHCPYCGGLLP